MRTRSFWVCVLCAVCVAAGCRRGSQADTGGKTAAVLELGCLPADCFAVVVIHPQRIVQSPQAAGSAEVKKFLEGEAYREAVKQLGFDFRDLKEVTLLVLAPPAAGKDVPEPAVILRFARPIDRDQVIGSLAGKEYIRSEQTHAGKTYYRFSPPKERRYARPRFFFAPDDRTIVFVEREEESMQKVLAAKGAEGPLADALRRADMNHEVAGAIVVEPVRALLGEVLANLPPGTPAEFAELKALVGQVKGATLVADAFGDPFAKASLQTDSPETAAKLLPMVQKGRELLLRVQQALEERQRGLKRKPSEDEIAAGDLLAQFLDGLSFSRRESELVAVVRLKNPELAFWLIRGPVEAYASRANWQTVAQDWETRRDRLHEEKADREAERVRLQEMYEAEKKARSEAKTAEQEWRKTLEQEIDAQRRALEKVDGERASALATLESTRKNMADLHAQVHGGKDKEGKEHKGLWNQVKEEQKAREEWFKRAVAEQDRAQQLANVLSTPRVQDGKLMQDARKYRDIIPGANLSLNLEDYTKVPPDVKGRVTAVSGTGLVEIDIGRDAGLRPGHQLEVYRAAGSPYLGKVEVLATEPQRAVCKVLRDSQKGEIQRDDHVSAHIRPK